MKAEEEKAIHSLDACGFLRAFGRPGALVVLIAALLLYEGTYLLGTFGSPVRADGVGYAMYLPAWVVHHSFGVETAAVARFGDAVPEWTGCERGGRSVAGKPPPPRGRGGEVVWDFSRNC